MERLLLGLILTPLAWLRRTLELHSNGYALLMLPQAQPWLQAIGRLRRFVED